jgi:hypothetical protein
MEPLTGLVLSAVGTVASGALSGAGGEMGRRTSERLFGLLSRARSEEGSEEGSEEDEVGSPSGESGEPVESGERAPTLPVTEAEQRAAALWLVDMARRSPEFAREVTEWVREAAWLAPRAVPAVAHDASRPQMLPLTTAAFTDRGLGERPLHHLAVVRLTVVRRLGHVDGRSHEVRLCLAVAVQRGGGVQARSRR